MLALRKWVEKMLPRGRIVRGVLLLAGGSAAAQVISIAASPILTRLYSPEDYGTSGVFGNFLLLLVIVATAQYEQAITLPAEDGAAVQLVRLCLVMVLLIASVCAVVLWFCGDAVLNLLNAPALGPYFWLLPVGLFAAGAYQALYYWAIRQKAYSLLSRTRLTQAVSGTAISLALGIFYRGPLGLILAAIAFQAAGITTLACELFRRVPLDVLHVRYHDLRQSAVTYRRFPLYVVPATFLSTASYSVPVLLLASLFGTEQSGYYGLAYRVISLPTMLVGVAVSHVFLAEAAQMLRSEPERLPGFFRRVTSRMAYVGLAIIVLGAISPFVFSFAFGAKWQMAGIYAACLSLRGAAQAVVSPISSIAVIRQRQAWQLIVESVKCLVAIVSIYVPFILGYSAMVAVANYCISTSLVYIWSYRIYSSLCRSAVPFDVPPPCCAEVEAQASRESAI
jgi:O-antigen/teichoic acid export membrane protein